MEIIKDKILNEKSGGWNFKNLIFKWKKFKKKIKKIILKIITLSQKIFIQKDKVEYEGLKALDQLCADLGLPRWLVYSPIKYLLDDIVFPIWAPI
jgi:hypothetical protein